MKIPLCVTVGAEVRQTEQSLTIITIKTTLYSSSNNPVQEFRNQLQSIKWCRGKEVNAACCLFKTKQGHCRKSGHESPAAVFAELQSPMKSRA